MTEIADIYSFIKSFLSPNSPKTQYWLINGSESVGKTSLLFTLAYECANKLDSVLFICNKSKIEKQLPISVSMSEISADVGFHDAVLARIHMVYIETFDDLNRAIVKLHLFKLANGLHPNAIFIDDLSNILLSHVSQPSEGPISNNFNSFGTINNDIDLMMNRRLFFISLLQDTIEVMQASESRPISLFVSDNIVGFKDIASIPPTYHRIFEILIQLTKIKIKNEIHIDMSLIPSIHKCNGSLKNIGSLYFDCVLGKICVRRVLDSNE